jgi:hypothetical protein
LKTHELARALNQLAQALQAGPNIVLGEIKVVPSDSLDDSQEEVAIGLHTLVKLSRIDKQQWLALIEENDFPINVRQRDASRDILGKLLRYLEKNAAAREKLKSNINKHLLNL